MELELSYLMIGVRSLQHHHPMKNSCTTFLFRFMGSNSKSVHLAAATLEKTYALSIAPF